MKRRFINLALIFTICIAQQNSLFTQELTPQKDKTTGKWGYVNEQKQEVVSCKYELATGFDGNLAAVCSDSKWGFINKAGQEVAACKYRVKSHSKITDSQGNLLATEIGAFSDGLLAVGSDDNKWGFIDQSGQEAIPCIYDNVHVGGFFEGMAAVESGDKWGFVDKTGQQVVPCEYNDVDRFSEGMAAVKSDSKWGFVNQTGQQTIPCIYNEVNRFSEGMAVVVLNNKCGFINQTGQQVIPCKYDGANSFSGGVAKVRQGKKIFEIDKTGKKVDQ